MALQDPFGEQCLSRTEVPITSLCQHVRHQKVLQVCGALVGSSAAESLTSLGQSSITECCAGGGASIFCCMSGSFLGLAVLFAEVKF